ncbi:lanthionine synthetase-like protein [Promicromonospora sp. AC04]|uniref:lanthionine synthetase C family protein n=1 Tax=Promicromonospora sp. AC04 TaxID=2135723 RepID=UPI000D3A3C4F|nr:lanthionine synthetase C family protein [Promicromonospora sp. AC04]PUB32588.1 lanthionine synthetase-like protein [Promicromonospora sp. AC04]
MSSPTLDQTQAAALSLTSGSVGQVLLSVERALAGNQAWDQARTGLRALAAAPVDAGGHTGLFYGAPALAFVLHTAQADGRRRAQATLDLLDDHVSRLARVRLAAAERRAVASLAPGFAEYDLFRGLVGFGALLLLRQPGSDLTANVLEYLVGLTRPHVGHRGSRPGWWVEHDPDPATPTPGGHANLGMAHGAAGLLALLGIAARRGVTVDGQLDAIRTLLDWFDRWRQDGPDGTWWPQWLTYDELRTGRPAHQHQPRPSWCYGTPGIARAIQIGAIATNDQAHRATAEAAIASALTSAQVARLTDPGLCHGVAGLYQSAYRASLDAADPTISDRLPTAAGRLTQANVDVAGDAFDGDPSFLTGRTGVELASSTLNQGLSPISGWDACLLIS